MNKGITYMETIIVAGLFAVLASVFVVIFSVFMGNWPYQEKRVSVQLGLDRAMEKMVRDLRGAAWADPDISGNEILYTDVEDNYYIYYIDEVNRLQRSPSDKDGTIDDDSATFIAADIDQDKTNLCVEQNDNNKFIITLDLTIKSGEAESRLGTKVILRNQL